MKLLCQNLGKFGLSDSGRANEKEASDGLVAVEQPGL